MAEADDDEIVRLERLGRLGWPSLESMALDGWIAGSSGAYTRRANSVAPERDGTSDVDARIERVERFYRERAERAVFKLTRAARPADLDARLAARGYTTDGETRVMTVDLEACLARSRPGEARKLELVANRVDDRWLAASVDYSRVPAARHGDYRAILERVLEDGTPALFGSIEVESQIVSVALGCVVGEALSFVQVATAPEARGRRHAEVLLRGLLHAAREQGAQYGLLSVEVANASACRLYERLGFRERYRYWYRERALASATAG